MLYTNTPEGRNDGHRQAENGCGLKGHLVGLMAPRPTCWHRSFMQQRAMSFNKRFQEKVLKVLGGFQVFWLSHAVTFSLQMREPVIYVTFTAANEVSSSPSLTFGSKLALLQEETTTAWHSPWHLESYLNGLAQPPPTSRIPRSGSGEP